MYSFCWMFRPLSRAVPSLVSHRFLALSRVQSLAAAKPKENTDSTVETTSTTIKTTQTNANTVDDKATLSTSSHVDPNKTYSDKIQRLVNEISKLSLVDVIDLNELLKVTSLFVHDETVRSSIVVDRMMTIGSCSRIENTQNTRRADCGIGRRHWSTGTGRTGTSPTVVFVSFRSDSHENETSRARAASMTTRVLNLVDVRRDDVSFPLVSFRRKSKPMTTTTTQPVRQHKPCSKCVS
jgi:hypothetical protein